jgi:hypothetical protein
MDALLREPKAMIKKRDITTAGHAAETIARRMPILWGQALAPTPKGQREVTRMVAEKQKAVVDGLVAAQMQMMREAMRFWAAPFAATTSTARAATRITNAATAPARKTVWANVKRLRKKG